MVEWHGHMKRRRGADARSKWAEEGRWSPVYLAPVSEEVGKYGTDDATVGKADVAK